MLKIINFTQIVVSVLVIALILIQNKGGGIGSVFGGGDSNVMYTKRGPEKWIFYATVAATALFIILGIVNLIISQQG